MKKLKIQKMLKIVKSPKEALNLRMLLLLMIQS